VPGVETVRVGVIGVGVIGIEVVGQGAGALEHRPGAGRQGPLAGRATTVPVHPTATAARLCPAATRGHLSPAPAAAHLSCAWPVFLVAPPRPRAVYGGGCLGLAMNGNVAEAAWRSGAASPSRARI
jgi:hypothetical protein